MTLLACFGLLVSLTGGIMVNDHAQAAHSKVAKKGKKLSSDLDEKAHGSRKHDTVKVILQLDGPMSDELSALLSKNHVKVKARFNNLKAHVIHLPASLVDDIAAFDEVAFISVDSSTPMAFIRSGRFRVMMPTLPFFSELTKAIN